MLTERELLQDIEECQKEPITDKRFQHLANCITVYNYLFGEPITQGYSFENQIEAQTIQTKGESEFLKLVNGKNAEKVMAIMDELMEVTQQLQPRVYDGVISRINEL